MSVHPLITERESNQIVSNGTAAGPAGVRLVRTRRVIVKAIL
jgi:hypothetical protein